MFFRFPYFFALAAFFCISIFFAPYAHAQVIPVTVSQDKSGTFHLMRDGKPYFVKGAGGSASLTKLKAAGANSLRVWGADNVGPILDEAQKLDMTVCVGIWFGHKEHGFSYDNPKQVKEQYERVRQTVTKYKNHPAVLAWALGNEMEIGEGGDAVWKAVGEAAQLTKQLDPNHPTLTVIAELGKDKVEQINRLCPNIDIIGINSYGGGPSLPARYKAAGGVRPYIITEFGPPGTWESPKKPWGAVPELTSTAKAETYRKTYTQAVQNQPLCVGSYAFTWGFKQEATATWYGMVLPSGDKLAAVDTMTELWTGAPPKNLCPVIRDLHLDGAEEVAPGSKVHAILAASDPENDKITTRWVLQRDDMNHSVGGDTQAVPPTFPDAIVQSSETGADVKMPEKPGAYRLFTYLSDGMGGAAVANLPLLVKGEAGAGEKPASDKPAGAASTKADVPKAMLPLMLVGETGKKDATYVPSGWMGNAQAVRMDEAYRYKPHTGATCVKVEYTASDNWAGVVWQSPAGDWGDKPGGLNLTGAKKLTIWARGENGGEEVTFAFGLLGKDKTYYDTATGKKEKIRLTTEWQPYTLDLSGYDLSRIKTGFAWIIAGQGKPVTFYLDDVRYE